MNDVLTLISNVWTKNKYGVDVPAEEPTRTEVFCECKSITRNEFFDAGRNGLNPQFVFTMFAGDYNGESLVEYNGKSYSVYRTYKTDDDYIELYVERKGGTNGAQSNS